MWLRSAIVAGKSRAVELSSAIVPSAAIDLGRPADSIRTTLVRYDPGPCPTGAQASPVRQADSLCREQA
jgi:hypothetical protein